MYLLTCKPLLSVVWQASNSVLSSAMWWWHWGW